MNRPPRPRLAEVRKKADNLKQPDKGEKDRIAKAYKAKLDKALNDFKTEAARVKSVPGGPDALKEIQSGADRKK